MDTMTVEELAVRSKSGDVLLLDVREPAEIAIAAVAGATCIPMGEIPARLGDLDRARSIAVMCHHGGRSEKVAALLTAAGFTSVFNIEGGIDAYSRRVDPAIPTY